MHEGKKPHSPLQHFARILPPYDVPKSYSFGQIGKVAAERLVSKGLLARGSETRPELNATNAANLIHELLWAEEAQLSRDIKTYDRSIHVRLATVGQSYYWIDVPGLLERRPSVLHGDFVWLSQNDARRSFKSWVHKVESTRILVHLPHLFDNRPPFQVRFSFLRTTYRNMHRALDENEVNVFAKTENFEQLMLRGKVLQTYKEAQVNDAKMIWVPKAQVKAPTLDDCITARVQRQGQRLNLEQIMFVEAVIRTVLNPFPILLWGPPGTGKTSTICEAILDLLASDGSARVLACCPSNASVDVLCERLAERGVTKSVMIRLNARSRRAAEVARTVLPFCPHKGARGVLGEEECDWVLPSAEELPRWRVILCTCSFAASLVSLFKRGAKSLLTFISHLFVDEAGQTMEAEVWIPLCLLKPGGKSLFIGDHRQLGSVVHNPFASKMGLEVSILERLWTTLGGGSVENSSRCFALIRSYRSHPSILRLFNTPVYGGMLRCDTERSRVNEFEDLGHRSNPVIFHHVEGHERKMADSPSWVNEDELEVVKGYVTQLIVERGMSLDDIGIISPYRKQCSVIRAWLEKKQWQRVEVGTVEIFQGNERKAIVVSTVRSQRRGQELQTDMRYNIGFLGSFRRTNVALSRAKSLMIVVGNLQLLGQDETWMKVLREVSSMGVVRASAGQKTSAAAGAGAKAVGTRWLSADEVTALIPSVGAHQTGRLRQDTSYSASVDARTGKVNVATSYAHLIVVDDGVRHAQGTRGMGLGTTVEGSRFCDDESSDEEAANPEAVWRDFE